MTQTVADPPPHYRIPSTIQSYPQSRTVRRGDQTLHLREVDVRVMWMEDKLRIWRDVTGKFWWVRCDSCLSMSVGSFIASHSWEGALQGAWRHAYAKHNVRL